MDKHVRKTTQRADNAVTHIAAELVEDGAKHGGERDGRQGPEAVGEAVPARLLPLMWVGLCGEGGVGGKPSLLICFHLCGVGCVVVVWLVSRPCPFASTNMGGVGFVFWWWRWWRW